MNRYGHPRWYACCTRDWWYFICWKAINYIVMINSQMSSGKRGINYQVGDGLETVPDDFDNQIAHLHRTPRNELGCMRALQ